MTRPTYDVRIDWDSDNDYDDVGENVTNRALVNRTPITIQYGRDQARALAPIAPGRAVLELDNTSGDYSPENTSSPLVNNLGPGRAVRIRAIHNDVTYTLYNGFLDDFDMEPSIGNRSVSFTLLDTLARLSEARLSTDLHQGITTGAAFGLILDAVGWGTAERDLDQGATLIPYWWEEGTDALTAVKNLMAAEGPPALVTINEQGYFVFRDRHHRLTETASLASQVTFAGAGNEPLMSPPLIYDLGWRDIVNQVRLEVPERTPEGELSDVWTSSATYTLADGETINIIARTSDPFIQAVTPVATTDAENPADYTILSGAVAVALSNTAGATTTVSITASGGPAVITDLKVRAYSVSVSRTFVVLVEDASSIAKHGLRSYPDPIPWVNVHDALAVAQLIITHRAERLPVVTMRVTGGNDTRTVQQLSRDLSDRVTITDADSGLDADFYIETIQHKTDGVFHETMFGCEKTRDAELSTDAFRFDTAGQGFDDGVFEGLGLMDPAFMFRFNTSGQGFNDGRMSY